MSESAVIEWPDSLPTPLIGRGHTVGSRSDIVMMESGRRRVRRMHDTPIEFIEATWNFTEDQFDTFKTWFENTLENGSLPFYMITTDPPSYRLNWELAFKDGNYEFDRSDNLFSVKAVLEVLDVDGWIVIDAVGCSPSVKAPGVNSSSHP